MYFQKEKALIDADIDFFEDRIIYDEYLKKIKILIKNAYILRIFLKISKKVCEFFTNFPEKTYKKCNNVL